MNQKIDLERIDPIIDKYKNNPGALIPILQEIQTTCGYISGAMMEYISKATGIRLSQVYGVATFYAQFRFEPYGKNVIKVCHGTACHVGGAVEISQAMSEELGVEAGKTTKDGKFTIESVACLGCCSLAPVMMINEKTFGRLSPESAKKVVQEHE